MYLSGHKFTPENVRLLHRAIFFAARAEGRFDTWLCSNVRTECAYYPNHRKLAVVNNSDRSQQTRITMDNGETLAADLEPYGSQIIDL